MAITPGQVSPISTPQPPQVGRAGVDPRGTPGINHGAVASAKEKYQAAVGRIGQGLQEAKTEFQRVSGDAQTMLINAQNKQPTLLKSQALYRVFARVTGLIERTLHLQKGSLSPAMQTRTPVMVRTERAVESSKAVLGKMDELNQLLEKQSATEQPGGPDHGFGSELKAQTDIARSKQPLREKLSALEDSLNSFMSDISVEGLDRKARKNFEVFHQMGRQALATVKEMQSTLNPGKPVSPSAPPAEVVFQSRQGPAPAAAPPLGPGSPVSPSAPPAEVVFQSRQGSAPAAAALQKIPDLERELSGLQRNLASSASRWSDSMGGTGAGDLIATRGHVRDVEARFQKPLEKLQRTLNEMVNANPGNREVTELKQTVDADLARVKAYHNYLNTGLSGGSVNDLQALTILAGGAPGGADAGPGGSVRGADAGSSSSVRGADAGSSSSVRGATSPAVTLKDVPYIKGALSTLQTELASSASSWSGSLGGMTGLAQMRATQKHARNIEDHFQKSFEQLQWALGEIVNANPGNREVTELKQTVDADLARVNAYHNYINSGRADPQEAMKILSE